MASYSVAEMVWDLSSVVLRRTAMTMASDLW